MPLSCLTAGRMTMSATLLHRTDAASDYVQNADGDGSDINLDDYGTWEDSQDPLTGEIVKIWEPHVDTYRPADDWNYFTPPGVRPTNNVAVRKNVPCVARGIVDGGIRVAGTTERFGASYENVDFLQLWVPANITVTKRDRITNVSDRHGRIQWLDEEFYDHTDPDSTLRATVFNVNGVTPLFDAFNNVVEWFVLCERVTDI